MVERLDDTRWAGETGVLRSRPRISSAIGGSDRPVDNYAAARNASGTVWTGGTLAAGDHTLTVRITGNRNPASAGAIVALDHAVVTG